MQQAFQHYMLVRQEHLNQYGSLFGGRVLSVIDELAFIACSQTYPGRNFVTRAIENAEFKAPAALGSVMEFRFGVEACGRTSITVKVELFVHGGQGPPSCSFDGRVVMVCVDGDGRPMPL